MKLKQLDGLLGSLQQSENPKIELEQYPTGPHIASRLLYTAENSFGDVSDKVVADFGCGCGTLGLAAGLLGAEHVIGFDIAAESIEIASLNADELEHIKRTALREYNASTAEVLCELHFDVPQLYKFHKKKEVDVAVDLWRFVPNNNRPKHL